MSLLSALETRCESTCELCGRASDLAAYTVPPKTDNNNLDHQIAACHICLSQIKGDVPLDSNHWRCLRDSMWSSIPAVQVMTYQLLGRLTGEEWTDGLKDQMYLPDEETEEWATFTSNSLVHKDSNGNVLASGDTVTLIQDLTVKGAGFTAKRGTSVRRIRLVHDNEEHIEGKIDGQQIVILTKYVKKST